MNDICGFTKAVLNPIKIKTATVYAADGKLFAEYTTDVVVDVAEDIGGYVVENETGEVTYTSRTLRYKENKYNG